MALEPESPVLKIARNRISTTGSSIIAAREITTSRFSPCQSTRRQPWSGAFPGDGLSKPDSSVIIAAGKSWKLFFASGGAIFFQNPLCFIEHFRRHDFTTNLPFDFVDNSTPLGLDFRRHFLNVQSASTHRRDRSVVLGSAIGLYFFTD